MAALNNPQTAEDQAYLLDELREVGVGDNAEAAAILERVAAQAAALQARDTAHAAKLASEAKAAAKARAKARAEARADPFGTASGLIAAKPRRGAVRLAVARRPAFLRGGVNGGEELGVFPPAQPTAPWRAVEVYPKLDIRTLAREGKLVAGALTLVQLRWPQSKDAIDKVILAIDMRRSQWAEIRIAFDQGGEGFVQTVGLEFSTVGGRRRPLFVCTRTGEVSETLSYRNGCFAVRSYQRLTFASQLTNQNLPNRVSKAPR